MKITTCGLLKGPNVGPMSKCFSSIVSLFLFIFLEIKIDEFLWIKHDLLNLHNLCEKRNRL